MRKIDNERFAERVVYLYERYEMAYRDYKNIINGIVKEDTIYGKDFHEKCYLGYLDTLQEIYYIWNPESDIYKMNISGIKEMYNECKNRQIHSSIQMI